MKEGGREEDEGGRKGEVEKAPAHLAEDWSSKEQEKRERDERRKNSEGSMPANKAKTMREGVVGQIQHILRLVFNIDTSTYFFPTAVVRTYMQRSLHYFREFIKLSINSNN